MSTRSNIGILNADGSVTHVYAHWDGYPTHNGVILRDHYNTARKVRQLIAGGSISVLGEKCRNFPAEHTWRDPAEGFTSYDTQRGERRSVQKSKYLDTYLRQGEEWIYLFTPGKGWTVSDHGAPFEPLDEAIAREEKRIAAYRAAHEKAG